MEVHNDSQRILHKTHVERYDPDNLITERTVAVRIAIALKRQTNTSTGLMFISIICT